MSDEIRKRNEQQNAPRTVRVFKKRREARPEDLVLRVPPEARADVAEWLEEFGQLVGIYDSGRGTGWMDLMNTIDALDADDVRARLLAAVIAHDILGSDT
jgi:hypothetical protein